MRTLEFWFDFASTYSYLSAMRIGPMAEAAGVEVRWRPFLLGPIFQALGWDASPFVLQPAKGAYMWRDIARRAGKHGLAWAKPGVFPRRSTAAVRAAHAGQDEFWIEGFVRAVFRRNFVEDGDIEDTVFLRDALGAAGAPADAVLTRAASDAGRAALRAQIVMAQARGIFGAPSFVVGDELFWGDDRLEDAIACAAR